MIKILRRLSPKSITAQITGLVIVAVLLGIGLSTTALLLVLPVSKSTNAPEVLAARIGTIIQLARVAPSPAAVDELVTAARTFGIEVEEVESEQRNARTLSTESESFLKSAVTERLTNDWGISTDDSVIDRSGYDIRYTVVAKISGDRMLLFHLSPINGIPYLLIFQTTLALTIITIFIILLSIYAVRWITSPLSSIASATHAFGRSSAEAPMLSERGPREISQVATALNEMRTRIQTLVDDRTRMLAAISHDLRTPLTRLRLRTERLSEAEAQIGMLQDIARISDMLSETLNYLRDGNQVEMVQRVDLPSVLQTICADFADVGHDVSYEGPNKLTYKCRPGALTRAVTNVVENGIHHGSRVVVKLRRVAETTLVIEVSDNGIGIPESLHDRVFDPFFKGDSARALSERVGFGLGLSIARDIVRTHGGNIDLFNRAPHGLSVQMSLAIEKI